MLKQRNPNVRVIAVEPRASAVLSGGKPGLHGIQGLGAGFIPAVLDTELIDEVITVTDLAADRMTKRLAREEAERKAREEADRMAREEEARIAAENARLEAERQKREREDRLRVETEKLLQAEREARKAAEEARKAKAAEESKAAEVRSGEPASEQKSGFEIRVLPEPEGTRAPDIFRNIEELLNVQ